jgi:hypothetical protein
MPFRRCKTKTLKRGAYLFGFLTHKGRETLAVY